MKNLIYSFRTNKHLPKGVFIFGKLKDDLEKFKKLIQKTKPKYIIGLAEVKTKTRIESVAVNKFNKTGKVSVEGKGSYKLYIPKDFPFSIAKKPTTSFCNWTMYKISEFLEGSEIKLIFVHFNKVDRDKVLEFTMV